MTTAVLTTEPNAAIPPFRQKKAMDAEAPLKHAAGMLLVSPEGRILLLKRSDAEANFAGHWGLPGGGVDDGETPWQGAQREAREEIGWDMPDGAIARMFERRVTPTGMVFHTFGVPTDEFEPTLNAEHSAFKWSALDDLPQPMHPAVMRTLTESVGLKAGDNCAALGADLAKWLKEAGDQSLKTDDEIKSAEIKIAGDGRAEAIARADRDKVLAFDRESVRSFDRTGRMHVAEANICKECVSPYRGNEIPGWQELGLDPERIYQLYRPGAELERAVKSANGIPLLRQHLQTSADDHQFWDTIGSTGTGARWVAPYIKNGLSIWSGDDIEDVKSGRKRELSPGYHYKPVMQPGVFKNPETGKEEPYDGLMTAIEFNHLATVEDGRQNTDAKDIIIGDSAADLQWAAIESAIVGLGA